jgi:lysophospholipase L1-like esterase
MRDLTKSMIRFSWAMSLYGMDRMREVVEAPPEAEDSGQRSREGRGADSLDSLSEATGERLRERTRRVYEAGDRLQAEMVDLFFDAAEPVREGMEHLFENAADWAERSAKAMRKAAREAKEAKEAKEAHSTEPADSTEPEAEAAGA